MPTALAMGLVRRGKALCEHGPYLRALTVGELRSSAHYFIG